MPPALCPLLLFFAFRSETVLGKLKSISKILKYIEYYYVEEVDLENILDGAIHGLLNELDPHSSYIEPKDAEGVKEQIQGEFEGIGIEFAILDGYITVVSPIPDTPSDRAGLISGDKIVKINNESAYMITQDEVFDKLRGPKGSKVELTIKRLNQEEEFNVVLVRSVRSTTFCDSPPLAACIVDNSILGFLFNCSPFALIFLRYSTLLVPASFNDSYQTFLVFNP